MSETMRRELNDLKKTVAGTNAAVSELKGEMSGLKGAVSELKGEVSELRGTVKDLGMTVAGIAASLERTNSTLDRSNGMLNRTMISVAQLSGDMAEVKHELATNVATKKDFSDLNARMDGFSGLLLDSRHRWAVHAETLSAHDARLKKLESPQA